MLPSNQLESLSTSASLIALVKNKDEDGWRCITELYGPLIYYWCRKSRLPPEDSADIVQDVFRSVLLHVTEFERDERTGAFRAWLWTITRNKIRDYIKVNAGKASATGGSGAYQILAEQPAIDENGSGLDDSVNDGLIDRVLKRIRGEVRPVTWDAFWRSTIDGVDPAVVAAELEISVHSVWQAKSRILRRARQLLDF